MPVLKPKALLDERVNALRKAHADAGCPQAELDLSGGIDSAVMAGLLVLALGPDKVTLVHSNINSNPEQTARAQALADAIGCPMSNINLGEVYNLLVEGMIAALVVSGKDTLLDIKGRIAADPTILGSIRSTLRAPVGRGFNRLTGNGIRHGTGNEDEDRFLRFYQKGGDGEVDSNPIAFLSKGETYQLAFALGQAFGPVGVAAFRTIIEATPSPDLWGNGDAHTDEAELQKWLGVPFTYSRIDPETGEYRYVGTIERVARFLDTRVRRLIIGDNPTFNDVVFGAAEPNWAEVVTAAKESGCFDEYKRSEVEAFLMAARRAERCTRHKLNPNCPTYGDRKVLVAEGILTDALPNLNLETTTASEPDAVTL